MKNNTRYVTQIESDIRRILKTLLSKNAHIEIDQDNDTTVIIGTYENRRNVYIIKDKNSCKYQIDFLDETYDEEITICFSSQSSVIDFLKNNFLS